ncbi:hypothetical protein [Jatrophihabitans fulvus]
MTSLLARSLVVGTGVAAAGVLLATSALAHGAPYTVKAGSAASGTTVAVTGTSGTINFKDTTTGVTLTCTSSTLTGSIKVGKPTTGSKIATISGSGAKFNGCTGPAGLKFAVTGVGTWYINISDSTSGVNKGTVSNIVANVKSTAGPTCSFSVGSTSGSSGTVVGGSVAGTFTNSTQKLVVPATTTGSLGLWNVKGGTTGTNTYCVSPSIIKKGDKASFSATYTLKASTAAYNPISIT